MKVDKRTEEIMEALSYRRPITVHAVMLFRDGYRRPTTYPICPRCNITMEREYQRYCDRCGQRLDWKELNHAKIVLPGCRQAANSRTNR